MAIRSARGAKTLPQVYYTSEEIFSQEREYIFYERWSCLGHLTQLPKPGSYFLHQLDEENLIVLRDEEGTVRVFYNVCRHRGTRLCTTPAGRLSHTLQCPYHAWTYALDGRLLSAPTLQEVDRFNRADYPLIPVAVASWEGFIFANLSDSPQPFVEAFAPLLHKFSRWNLSELVVVHQVVYEVAANWKLLFQNYSECYHCPTLHPQLNRLTPYRSADNDLTEGSILGGPMMLSNPGGSMTMDGRRCAAPLGKIAGDDLNLVYYYTIFPTMFFSLHPDYALTHRLEPQSPSHTRVVCQWLFHPDAAAQPDFTPSSAIEFWDMTNRQDWQICELSQQGISSRAYRPGPYAELESLLAAIDREYLRLLHGDESVRI